MNGLFIVFEGIDGSGKTTQARRLTEHLSKTVETALTREPGGTEMGEEIRRVLLEPRKEHISPETELLLFFAARNQHINEKIRPLRERGVWVVCDRFIDSSYSYQVIGKGGSLSLFNTLIDHVIEPTDLPDITIVIHLDEDERVRRLTERTDERNRLDEDDDGFHQRASHYLLDKADKHPNSYLVVDGSGTPDEVFDKMLTALNKTSFFSFDLKEDTSHGS